MYCNEIKFKLRNTEITLNHLVPPDSHSQTVCVFAQISMHVVLWYGVSFKPSLASWSHGLTDR